MTDGSERPAGLSEKRAAFLRWSPRRRVGRGIIGLVRVSRGSGRTELAPCLAFGFFDIATGSLDKLG